MRLGADNPKHDVHVVQQTENESALSTGPREKLLEQGVSRGNLNRTSLATTSEAYDHVFQKKTKLSTNCSSFSTERTSEGTTGIDSTALNVKSVAIPKDPLQWHTLLVETEAARRMCTKKRLEISEQDYSGLQQLMADALKETAAACRLTIGVAKAQEQLSNAHALPSIELEDEDGETSVTYVTDLDSLPEKLKRAEEDEENVRSSAALPGSGAEIVAPVTPPSGKRCVQNWVTPTSNDGSQPPVFSICFPNPETSDEAFYVLYKQHDLLQQAFARTISSASIEKMQMIKELCSENVNKLEELASSIVKGLHTSEQNVRKLWGA